MSDEFYFFKYEHSERDFFFIEEVDQQIVDLMRGDPSTVPDKLSELEIDSLLILDYNTGHWWLAYSNSLGIVGERTARRQADSIRRSGITLPDGYWLKETKFPLEELSDPNLGDLWKTVQNKYLTGDLSGLELDPETGIPKQIKERADRLKSAGHSDALTEAKQELEEAKNRKKAMKRSGQMTMDDFLAKPKKKTAKKVAKKAPAKKVAKKEVTKKEVTKKEVAKKEVAKKEVTKKEVAKKEVAKKEVTKKTAKKEVATKASKPVLFSIDSLIEYVKNGNTEIVCRGNIKVGKKKPKTTTINFSQDIIKTKEWIEKVVFLEEGMEISLTFDKFDEINYATGFE